MFWTAQCAMKCPSVGWSTVGRLQYGSLGYFDIDIDDACEAIIW